MCIFHHYSGCGFQVNAKISPLQVNREEMLFLRITLQFPDTPAVSLLVRNELLLQGFKTYRFLPAEKNL